MLDIWTSEVWLKKSNVKLMKRTDADILEIDKLVDAYHNVADKTDIDARHKPLKKLWETCEKFVKKVEKMDKIKHPVLHARLPAVKNLQGQTGDKLDYLSQIVGIEKRFPYFLGPINKGEPLKQSTLFKWAKTDGDKIDEEAQTLHQLRAWVGIDPDNPDKTMESAKILDKSYWTEVIDPLNRNSQNVTQEAFGKCWNAWNSARLDAITKKGDLPGYHAWLEGQDQKAIDAMQQSKYQDDVGRDNYRVTIKSDGTAQNVVEGNLMDFDTAKYKSNFHGQGWAIFVIGAKDKQLYANSHLNAKGFYHACFMAGAPVIAAGELQARDGKIWRMTPKSGHYKPGVPEMVAGLKWLKDQKVKLDDGFEIMVYGPNPKKPDDKGLWNHWWNGEFFLSKGGKVKYDDDGVKLQAEKDWAKPLDDKECRIEWLQGGSTVAWDGSAWKAVKADEWTTAAKKNA